MKSSPILFSGPMVRALLDGCKTQTRRILKVQPRNVIHKDLRDDGYGAMRFLWLRQTGPALDEHVEESLICPYGVPGDLLWVRETCCTDWTDRPIYKANGGSAREAGYAEEPRWRPSIHMPRWASRLTLRLTDVRVERVQDASHLDILAEGVRIPADADGGVMLELTGKSPPAKFLTKAQLGDERAILRAHWASLWENTNGPGAWERNDWVWALTFDVIRENVDAALQRLKEAA